MAASAFSILSIPANILILKFSSFQSLVKSLSIDMQFLKDMVKEIIYTGKAPKPVASYSQAIRCDKLLFISGQLGIDVSTGKLAEGSKNKQERLSKISRQYLNQLDTRSKMLSESRSI